jgi:hypothetical protein
MDLLFWIMWWALLASGLTIWVLCNEVKELRSKVQDLKPPF